MVLPEFMEVMDWRCWCWRFGIGGGRPRRDAYESADGRSEDSRERVESAEGRSGESAVGRSLSREWGGVGRDVSGSLAVELGWVV